MFWISSIRVLCFIRGWIHSPRFGSSKSDSTAKTPRRKVFSSERRRLPRHQHVKGGREGHLRRNSRLTSAMRDEIKRPCHENKGHRNRQCQQGRRSDLRFDERGAQGTGRHPERKQSSGCRDPQAGGCNPQKARSDPGQPASCSSNSVSLSAACCFWPGTRGRTRKPPASARGGRTDQSGRAVIL